MGFWKVPQGGLGLLSLWNFFTYLTLIQSRNHYGFPAGRAMDYPAMPGRPLMNSGYSSGARRTPAGRGEDFYRQDLTLDGVVPELDDQYFCTAIQMPYQETYITNFIPKVVTANAHHVVVFGCKEPSIEGDQDGIAKTWDCGRMFGTCASNPVILYSWAKDAPPMNLPDGVGFRVGGNTDTGFLVLQVHFNHPQKTKDFSGVQLVMTPQPQPNIAGIYILYSVQATVPPNSHKFHVDVSCYYKGTAIIPFGFRTHTHDHGTVVAGYRIRNGIWTLIGKGNPQSPQAFYPVTSKRMDIKYGDMLAARCTYNNEAPKSLKIGRNHDDEMCNFYIMYYTDSRDGSSYGHCHDDEDGILSSLSFPQDSDTLPNSVDIRLEDPPEIATSSAPVKDVEPFPRSDAPAPPELLPVPVYKKDVSIPRLGQVGGIATDAVGRLVVFHRASRVWNMNSFDWSNHFQVESQGGTIKENTFALVDSLNDDHVIQEWGKDFFYMPHGLTIDDRGHLWVTDVGLHQVFRFPELGNMTYDLVLGQKLVPGNDKTHFCKPTDVAVMRDGSFFVADGYCNYRIMRFDSKGVFDKQWGQSSAGRGLHPPPLAFSVPHGLALAEQKGVLCVADRENGRIQCTDLRGTFLHAVESNEFHRLFAVEYSPVDDVLYAVNGPSLSSDSAVKGFTISLSDFKVIDSWTRAGQSFDQPHDVTVTPDGRTVFVGEIGPDRISKFEVTQSQGHLFGESPAASGGLALAAGRPLAASGLSSFGAFIVVVGIVIVFGGAALVGLQRMRGTKLKKIAKFQINKICLGASGSGEKGGNGYYPPMGEKLNLGSLLNRRQGFDRLRTEDGELDHLSEDLSDVEEYEATGETTELQT